MTFTEWIEAERGRLTQVAERFGITKSAVSQWQANGVPIDRIIDVRDLTGGAVSVEEMLQPRADAARERAA